MASVGFCEELNDTIGGSWDSNITWFGSIVHLTCMDGYTLKGNGTIQCVPGVMPYYPIWNESIPDCKLNEIPSTMAEATTGKSMWRTTELKQSVQTTISTVSATTSENDKPFIHSHFRMLFN
ncbi:uncharacterized protein LOC121431570 [Lytechinus variegatus]|uniref:uncharacterized protein LOC121431570 n=1 Tax=Lytechinus variegatus TaxID=7654 RepID=UPI001BB202D7|nr:uncharacterized protein LOC121431570 [Lytechinus variegatus]